jgi:hypothetical protein
MYAVIRRYKFDPKNAALINRHVNEGFIPLVRQTPGFVAYYWLDAGDGSGASVGLFQDKAGADQSILLAADYVKEHLAGILGKPEITEGNVAAQS